MYTLISVENAFKYLMQEVQGVALSMQDDGSHSTGIPRLVCPGFTRLLNHTHKQLSVVEMALRRRQAFRDNPELQQFVIPEARPTGRQLGVGSYGSVEELQVKGLVCAGKRMHEALLERDNEGVSNMERKYLEECQVTPNN